MAIAWTRTPWVTLTSYAVGARVYNGTVLVGLIPVPAVYEAKVAGTSGAAPGPLTHVLDAPITDGSVTWVYRGPLGGVVIELAPGLSVLPASQAAELLIVADTWVNEEYFGAQSDPARLYAAAHFATLALKKGLGALGSEGVGPFSRSYQMAPGVNGNFALTSWGAVFAAMQQAAGVVGGFVVGMVE